MPKPVQGRREAQSFLKENRLLSLATSNNDLPRCATVFYAYDSNFNLYFSSREDTRHCLDIAVNRNVAVVINHAWKGRGGKIRGLQLMGRAQKVPRKNYLSAFARYTKRFAWAKDFAHDHTLYVVKPSEIWYIDQALFGHFFRVRIKLK